MATHLWVDLKMKIQNLKHMKTIINISSTWSLVMNTRPDPKINHHNQKWDHHLSIDSMEFNQICYSFNPGVKNVF